jgi:hypothetical protein
MSGAEGGRGLGGGAPAFRRRPPAICRRMAHYYRCQLRRGLRHLSQDLVESLDKPPEKDKCQNLYIKNLIVLIWSGLNKRIPQKGQEAKKAHKTEKSNVFKDKFNVFKK